MPETCAGETRLSLCESVNFAMGSVGIGNSGGWFKFVSQAKGSGIAACWCWDVSTLGAYFSTLGVGTATPGRSPLGYYVSVVGMGTLGGGVVGGIQVLVVRGTQVLRRFTRVFFIGYRRNCGQLGQVGPSLEEIPEFCDLSLL